MYATHFLFASPFNVVILLAVVAFCFRAARLFSMMKHSGTKESDISTGLNILLLLSGGMILLGCLGYFSALAAAPCNGGILPGGSFVTVICTVADSADQVKTIAECFAKSASVMLTGLLAAAGSGLVWFSLKNKFAHR